MARARRQRRHAGRRDGQHLGAPAAAAYHLRAWPLIYGTLLTSVFAVIFGLAISLLTAIFIVDFAPPARAAR